MNNSFKNFLNMHLNVVLL